MFLYLSCVWYQVFLASMDCPFLIAPPVPSVFSKVYCSYSYNLMTAADSVMRRNSTILLLRDGAVVVVIEW